MTGVNAAQLPTLHVLAIGVSKYQDPALMLDFAAADARSIADAFAETGKGALFGNVQCTALLDGDATTPKVLAALERLQKVSPNDQAIVFFAGHGVKDKSGYYLLTCDAQVNALGKTALSGAALIKELRNVPCQVLLMLDACHAAGFGEGKKLATSGLRPASDDVARTLTDDEVGIAVLCAAMGSEKAAERNGHGLFTKAVLEALTPVQEVQYNRYNQRLYVHHLYQYVFDEVAQHSGDQQHPFLSMPWVVESFPLAQFKQAAAGK